MRIIPILVAVIVTAVLYMLVFERESVMAFAQNTADAEAAAEETQNPTAVSVLVRKSTAQAIDSAVILRGQTEADRQVDVRSETMAIVRSAPLHKGTYVEADQILCELAPGTRASALAETEARLAEAKGRVPEAEARLQEAIARLQEANVNNNAAAKLSVDGFASETRVVGAEASVRSAEAGVQSAKSGVQSAKSGIQSAEAAVDAARNEIERLTIRAPFEGLLESDTAELGALMQPGGLCGTIIQLNPIKLVGYVPETEVNRITVDAMAAARLTSGQEVQGRVTFLSRAADMQTRTFRVEIEVANDDLSIRDGQTAEILIASDGAKAHLLPQSALTLNDEGTLGVRVVDENSEALFVPVALVRDTAQGVWVTGLSEQADVIVLGQEYVTNGVPVAPKFAEVSQ
jgi:multidrug efflux system membrane fusion protein